MALIGWIKAGPPKKPLLFDHVNRLIVHQRDVIKSYKTLTIQQYYNFYLMQN